MPTPQASTVRKPLRLAVINDYPLVTAGLEALLAPYADRARLVELAAGLDVVSTVDMVLYDTFARTAASRVDLAQLCREQTVVIYAWNLGPESVAHARRVGAVAVLSKSLSADQLVGALERVASEVAAGRRDFLVLDGDEAQDAAPVVLETDLSPREIEVLALVAQGFSNVEIAAAMFVSINTVKSYVRTSYRKIGAESRSQAVLWCVDHGLRVGAERVLRP